MTITTDNHLPTRSERIESRSTDELVERFLAMELSEVDEGLTERALVEMLERETSARPSRCFAGNVIRCLENEERSASRWSQRAVVSVVVSAIAMCGSGVLLLARLAGLPTAPGVEWLPILRASWSTALETPGALAALMARLAGSWADAQSAVEWAYSPELLLVAGLALSVAMLALGVLARLMNVRPALDPMDAEALG